MKKYYAVKVTGSWRVDGTQEVGSSCSCSHKSYRAALKCAKKHGVDWQVGILREDSTFEVVQPE